ncbi:MAG TPA: Hsp20/alpha crystallin family protein [Thermoanaerobaculia bacterium]|jgi:HSP20 family protein|nr:Hsp20/alpha crystallin family protein [Thermoanaerobaculia bacterium]
MAPLKKIYLEELGRIQERINSLFEQALLPAEYEDTEGGPPGTWSPAVDVLETEDSYLLFAELPGVRREDIQLQTRDRRLELSGRRQPLGENRNFLRMERSYGPFRRTFDLGESADLEGTSAAFEQGILRVLIPKSPGGTTRVPVGEEGH